MKKIVLILFAVVFFMHCAIGQKKTTANIDSKKGVFAFDKTSHDFGSFKEEEGNVTCSFIFKNTGDAPILISSVRASCGCTSSGWTKEPILPGKEGFVEATYKAKGRPGQFHKTVTVNSNATEPRKILRIRGIVIPRVKTIAELYPRKMDDLWLNTNNASISRVYNDQSKKYTLKGYNNSENPMKFSVKDLPEFITVELPTKKIEPKEKFSIPITYHASKLNGFWGYKSDKINLVINDRLKPNYKVTVTANIVENFSKLTSEEKANAPVIGMSEGFYNFKQIKQGEIAEHIFKITNIGKSDLIIRKVETTCDCVKTDLGNEVIAPGKQTELKVTFDSKGRKGNQNKYVNLITNDPKLSYLRIRISGKIVQ